MIQMLKVLIADDEPKIRNGLFESVNWAELDMSVVGLAKDGEEAYKIACSEKPDICLVDICMPAINGLELIEKLKEASPETIAIIITGHDEFDYAQKAVKLKVFDYLLKPIDEEELSRIIEKAKKELEGAIAIKKSYEWAKEQLEKSMPVLKFKFITDWINGKLTLQEIEELLEFHNIDTDDKLGVVLLKVQGTAYTDKPNIEWERQLLFFAVQNIFEEYLQAIGHYNLIRDENDNFVAIVSINSENTWKELKWSVEESIDSYLKRKVTLYAEEVAGRIEDVPTAYEELIRKKHAESLCLPLVKKVKTYIEKNYANSELSLQSIADELKISLSYLSRLFKQEVGMPFIDYLIKVRITNAIKLMNDPQMKIYEVAADVGYGSQHYFCAAFKKLLGVSPSEYRQKEHLEL
jgi:two-component system, response regulator YesN